MSDRKHHKKVKKESNSSNSSNSSGSSSDSSSSRSHKRNDKDKRKQRKPERNHKKEREEKEIVVKIEERKEHRKHSPRKRSCSPKKRSCSPRKRSCSPKKELVIEVIEEDCKEPRKRSCSPRKRSCSPRKGSKSSRHGSKSPKKHSRSPRRGSKSPCSPRYEEKQMYEYLKYKLLEDSSLLAGGDDCFGTFFSMNAQTISLSDPVLFEQNGYNRNIEHKLNDYTMYVRKSGVFLFHFNIIPSQASQWTIFVNGLPQFNTTMGIGSGGGQLTTKFILNLQDNDSITVRNFSSSIGTVTLPALIGGPGPCTNASLVMRKLAPLPCKIEKREEEDECFDEHLHKKWEERFEMLKDRMLDDPQLMVAGSDAYGSVYVTAQQSVAVNAPVLFDSHDLLHNISHVLNSGNVTIGKDGVYCLTFLVGTTNTAQFTVFVNGNAVLSTTAGTNKGANELILSDTLLLKKNDVVSIVNFTSGNGTIVISQNAGGSIQGVGAVMLLEKIAPYCPVEHLKSEHKYEDKLYKKYRHFLLKREHKDRHMELDGSSPYSSVYSETLQIFNANDLVNWEINGLMRDVAHKSGTKDLTVWKDGVYEFCFGIQVAQPAQFTLYVNNLPIANAVSGSESGSGQVLIRQLVQLKKGDVLSIRNYLSGLNPITTEVDPGGTNVGMDASFVLVRIAPKCFEDKKCDDKKGESKRN